MGMVWNYFSKEIDELELESEKYKNEKWKVRKTKYKKKVKNTIQIWIVEFSNRNPKIWFNKELPRTNFSVPIFVQKNKPWSKKKQKQTNLKINKQKTNLWFIVVKYIDSDQQRWYYQEIS